MSGGNHAFVCDGYDAENDQFHFNWGWNGRYDGWFAMDALNPGGRDYSSKKSAIVGIQPLEKSMYAIFSDNGKTLTYYCDREKDNRGEKYYQMFRDGTIYTINVPFWSNRDSITKIVIDPSFVDGRPDTVETLFQGMRNLENIVNIQYLNTSNIAYMNGMFRGCSSLKEIDISNFDFSNTISMSSMFENCSSLVNVKLPNQLKCIGEKMFRNCSRLSSIYLPNRIDSISASAFSGCYDLKSVTVAFRVPLTISRYTFSYRANATLYVPNGSKEAFAAADYWKEFKSIEEYEYYEPGDVNMDGTVEISDVVLMVNYILGNNASETVLKYGDMNESGDIDISDVVAIVNRILGE
jgi:surface protein